MSQTSHAGADLLTVPVSPENDRLGLIVAILAGAAIPLTAFGKVMLAFSLIPALGICIYTFGGKNILRHLVAATSTPLAAFVGIVFALWAISAAGSLDIPRSFQVWGRSLLYILSMMILARRLSRDPSLMSILQKSLVGTSGAILATILFVIYVSDAPLTVLQALGSSKGQADTAFKAYASAMVCLLPIVLWSGISLGGRWQMSTYIIVPGVLLFLWGTRSRAALLGLIAAFLAVIVIRSLLSASQGVRRAIVAILVMSTLISAATLLVRLPQSPVINDADYQLPTVFVDHHRQLIWSFVVGKIKEKPWFGHGIDIINQTEGAAIRIPEMNQNFVPSHPHNWVLEISAETGLLGLTAITITLLFLLRSLAVIAGSGQLVGWAGIASFAAFWGSGLTNFSIWASWWQVVFLLIMAIVFAATPQNSHNTEN
jgi:O-antigen ligase